MFHFTSLVFEPFFLHTILYFAPFLTIAVILFVDMYICKYCNTVRTINNFKLNEEENKREYKNLIINTRFTINKITLEEEPRWRCYFHMHLTNWQTKP